MNILIGSDPEFLVRDTKEDRIVSALDVLPNGKEDKIDLGDGVELYADNANAEASIKPADTEDGLVKSFADLVVKSSTFLAKRGLRLMAQAAHTYEDRDLQHPVARIAGCGVAFNAHTISIQEPPDLSETNLRVCGGHIHMSRDNWKTAKDEEFLVNPYSRVAACRAVEWYLAPVLVLINNDPTGEIRTKNAYSQPGAHRTPPWGLEYRVPSNFWCSDPRFVRLTDRVTRFAVNEGEKDPEYWLNKLDLNIVADIILNSDKKAALDFIKKNHPKEIAKEAKSLARLPYSPYLDKNYGVA